MARKKQRKVIKSLPVLDVKKEVVSIQKQPEKPKPEPKLEPKPEPKNNLIPTSKFKYTADDLLNNDFYVVNVKGDEDRWTHMLQQLRLAGFTKKPIRYEANTKVNSNYHILPTILNARCKQPIENFEDKAIGASMSQLSLWFELLKKDLPYMYIMEDDCVFPNGFKEYLDMYLKHTPEEFDILLIGCEPDNKRGLTKIHEFGDNKYIASVPSFCLHNYIITKSGVLKYLEHIREYGFQILDCDIIDMCWENKLIHYEYVFNGSFPKAINYNRSVGLVGQTKTSCFDLLPEDNPIEEITERVECECGVSVKRKGIEAHRKTKKHLSLINLKNNLDK